MMKHLLLIGLIFGLAEIPTARAGENCSSIPDSAMMSELMDLGCHVRGTLLHDIVYKYDEADRFQQGQPYKKGQPFLDVAELFLGYEYGPVTLTAGTSFLFSVSIAPMSDAPILEKGAYTNKYVSVMAWVDDHHIAQTLGEYRRILGGLFRLDIQN